MSKSLVVCVSINFGKTVVHRLYGSPETHSPPPRGSRKCVLSGSPPLLVIRDPQVSADHLKRFDVTLKNVVVVPLELLGLRVVEMPGDGCEGLNQPIEIFVLALEMADGELELRGGPDLAVRRKLLGNLVMFALENPDGGRSF